MSKQTELAQVADTITVNSGNIGIGTTQQAHKLSIEQSNKIGWVSTVGSDKAAIEFSGVDDSLRFYNNSGTTERMRIDSSGDVSFSGSSGTVGTVKGNGTVTISDNHGSNNGGGLAFHYTGNSGYSQVYVKNNNTLVIDADPTAAGGSTNIEFNIDGSEAMRIDSSGHLLVGTTSILDAGSENAIHIQGSTSAAKWCMVTQSHSRGRVHVHTSSGGISDYFITGSTNVGAISQSTTSTSYATSSDYRLKTDAQPMTGASARVQALNPVNFEWIADGTRVDGFLAHEAQAVVPEAVTGAKDAMRDEEYEVTPAVLDDDGNVTTEAVMGTRSVPDYQGIDQSKLVPLLTAALQEALTKIDDLETRLTALEAV